jgi:rhamnose transport system permease protein
MAAKAQPTPNLSSRLRRLLLSQEGILFIVLIIATFILSRFNPNFLSANNLLNQGRLLAEVGLVALPMTYIIITGGIDLSVGSVLGLCAILLGIFWKAGVPLGVAVVLVLIVGVLAGAFNALFIVWLDVPPLIMTLATLALYRGMAQGISQARSVRGYPEWFYIFGQENILGLPTQLWFLVIGIAISAIVLARTTLGRALYAIGNNVVGARFSGLRVSRALVIIYSFSGFMAALAAVVFVSRVTTTRSDMGTGLELDAIAAVVLGGTSIMGGKGTILGTVIGLVFIQLLKYGLQLAGVTGDATIIVIGSVLIVTVLLNNLIQRRRGVR